jgi:adenine-specific DNA methylase
VAEGQNYPKRLIEVDLPIRKISEHARREKSIRHGHISTLHIWWARRPLAACRAIACATLWPDPADPCCPEEFSEAAATILCEFAENVRTTKQLMELTAGNWSLWRGTDINSLRTAGRLDGIRLRELLFALIADFANWDAATVPQFIETASRLTEAAQRTLSPDRPKRPFVVDPFCGGGAIPLEALRVGADAFASDVNPVPVLLNRVTLEYAPRYRQKLTAGVRRWGAWVAAEALKRLKAFYPADADGAQPVTYLWARTIRCEGPGCGAQVPLLRSLWLARKGKKSIALRLVVRRDKKSIEFEITHGASADGVARGTSKGGAATCPVCSYTTPVESVRAQLLAKQGGAADARLLAVLATSSRGRQYRLPNEHDLRAVAGASAELERQKKNPGTLKDIPLVPDGEINHLRGFFNIVLYGIKAWGDLFSPRQTLALTTLCELVRDMPGEEIAPGDPALAHAIRTTLALVVDRVAVRCTANCIWDATTECIMQVFNQGQALPARWEFAEMCPALDEGSGWSTSIEYTIKVLEHLASLPRSATIQVASATHHPLPDDSADAVITDPPYYSAIPYADLSDFFYSWLRRSLCGHLDEQLRAPLVPKEEELVSLAHRAAMYRHKNNAWFEDQMKLACKEGRRVCVPSGLGVWVFANKETAAWEAMLSALIDAGWIVTASWPIDTESGNRLRAKDSAALASSVHLVCRPREAPGGSVREDDIGSWRDVLSQLPTRIHDWLPRLAHEGVVGADAIFACLGPALEIFSRYSRVEKASGEAVALKEYLEHVWAAVSREALSMIFEGADASGLEEDARLSAIWLWTHTVGSNGQTGSDEVGNPEEAPEDDADESDQGSKGAPGAVLEFDAARKIAQGIGARLEALTHVVEVKGSKARLLPVAERSRYLFAKSVGAPTAQKAVKKKQTTLFAELEQAAEAQGWGDVGSPKAGTTTLDRVHQAMLLFGAGRGEALKRFVIEEGVGNQPQFWKLAQSLSALYPSASAEKRWVDGVLARKKGLGFG